MAQFDTSDEEDEFEEIPPVDPLRKDVDWLIMRLISWLSGFFPSLLNFGWQLIIIWLNGLINLVDQN